MDGREIITLSFISEAKKLRIANGYSVQLYIEIKQSTKLMVIDKYVEPR